MLPHPLPLTAGIQRHGQIALHTCHVHLTVVAIVTSPVLPLRRNVGRSIGAARLLRGTSGGTMARSQGSDLAHDGPRLVSLGPDLVE